MKTFGVALLCVALAGCMTEPQRPPERPPHPPTLTLESPQVRGHLGPAPGGPEQGDCLVDQPICTIALYVYSVPNSEDCTVYLRTANSEVFVPVRDPKTALGRTVKYDIEVHFVLTGSTKDSNPAEYEFIGNVLNPKDEISKGNAADQFERPKGMKQEAVWKRLPGKHPAPEDIILFFPQVKRTLSTDPGSPGTLCLTPDPTITNRNI